MLQFSSASRRDAPFAGFEIQRAVSDARRPRVIFHPLEPWLRALERQATDIKVQDFIIALELGGKKHFFPTFLWVGI